MLEALMIVAFIVFHVGLWFGLRCPKCWEVFDVVDDKCLTCGHDRNDPLAPERKP